MIMALFKQSIQYLEPKIQTGMHQMFEGIDQMALKDGLENCLDAFCDFVGSFSHFSSSQKEWFRSNTRRKPGMMVPHPPLQRMGQK